METVDINPIAFLYLIILIAPVFILNRYLHLRVNPRLFTAVARMAMQLIIAGLFLQYVFSLNNPWLNLLFIAVMTLAASFSAVRSCRLKLRRYFLDIFVAMAVPNFLGILFFNSLLLALPDVFDARYTITIAGMLLGNSLNGVIVSIDSFYSGVTGDQKRYLQMLCLSCSRKETLRPYFRKAVAAALNPFIATVETMGIVALPGMMTGQILGGASPMLAVKYQIAIMLAILAARYFSVLLAISVFSRRAFDEYDVLRP